MRPSATLVLVTALLTVYGSTRFAWLAGPLAALGIWWLDGLSRRPRRPAPARNVPRASIVTKPEPVD